MKNFKKSIATVALSATLLFGLTACGKGPEGVVAVVNNKEITEEQFLKEYAAVRNSFVMDQAGGDVKILDESFPGQEDKTIDEFIKEMTLENLVKIELIEEDAKKYKVEVTDKEIEDQLQQDIQSAGGEENFKAELTKQGISEDFYKTFLQRKILTGKYYEAKFKEIAPTDEEVKKYYDDHKSEYFTAKASHILVETEKEAKDVKKELDKGADFAKFAKEKSIEPAAQETGGDLGEFTNDTMVPEFSEAIAEMKVGELSKPVKSDFGYHIIKLEEKKERPLEDVQEEIKTKILIDKDEKYNQELEKSAKVKKYLKLNEKVELPENLQLDSEKKANKEEVKEETKEEVKEEVKAEETAAENTKEAK